MFYNEFLKTVDTCEMACAVACQTPDSLKVLSFYRGANEEAFGKGQLAALEVVLPHLKTALHTRRRLFALESRVADMEAAFDQLSTAMLLIDKAANVVFANRKALTF